MGKYLSIIKNCIYFATLKNDFSGGDNWGFLSFGIVKKIKKRVFRSPLKYMIMTHYKIMALIFLCVLLHGCKKNTSSELIVFDITANYPTKTLDIEDVADIEYLVLDISNDNYLFRYFHAMTDNLFICIARDQFIFFSRITGKPVGKLNRYGAGPGEYGMNTRLPVYCEIEDELFIYDFFEIKVYGMDGTFKRKLPPINNTFFPWAMYNFDDENLLINGFSLKRGGMRDSSFFLMSKQNGDVDFIHIPFEELISIIVSKDDVGTFVNVYPAVHNGKDFLLTDQSSDTVYRLTPERKLIPVLVRQPSIQTMKSKIFLDSWLETEKYLFFSAQSIDIDWNTYQFPPTKGYLMSKNTGQFFRTNVQMRDYKGKELILGPSVIHNCPNSHTGIIVWNVLELHAANKENKLSGKLKQATERLTEDDEYIFMILNFK